MIIKKKQILTLIFYVAYFFIIISDMFSQIKVISDYLNYFDYIALFLLIVVFIIQNKNYHTKSLIYSVMLLIIGIITFIYSKDKTILKLIMLLITFKEIDFDKFIKTDCFLKIGLLLFVVLAFFLGFTNNILVYREGILRNAFGFSHPNKIGLYLMMISLESYYIMRNKKIIIPFILSIIISSVIFLFIDSRTTLLIIILNIIFICLNKIFKNKILEKKIIEIVVKNLFLILTIITLILAHKFSFNNSFLVKLNQLLSYRISYNHYFLTNYGINIFGNFVETSKYLILDSSYLNIILRFGYILFFCLYFLFYKSFKDMYKKKNYILLIIFVLLLFYGFSESFLYKVSTNAFLLYFSRFINK